jgi:Beta-galactosidase/Lacto-N-biose phosphorylase central domain/NPCBM-associated, NEW3 domain of alpha-galactosidase
MNKWHSMWLIVLFSGVSCISGNSKFEAEKTSKLPSAWIKKKLKGASGGSVLQASVGHRLPSVELCEFNVSNAGKYRIWVRFYIHKDKKANFYILVRDQDGTGIVFKKIDFGPRLPNSTPYKTNRNIKRAAGFQWNCLDVNFEHSGNYTVNAGSLVYRGACSPRIIDCVVITDDLNYTPSKDGLNFAESNEVSTKSQNTVPRGYKAGKPYLVNSSFFSGIKDFNKQFSAGLVQCGVVYLDPARIVTLGFNRDHGRNGDLKSGLFTMQSVGRVNKVYDRKFKKQHPFPQGRFINSTGQAGKYYSISYDPLVKQQLKECADRVKKHAEEKGIKKWSICAELGGWLDYSKYSVDKFHNWLKKRYGNIAELNKTWNTEYKDFKSVTPAKSSQENKAAWFDFREFCGERFVKVVAEQVSVIKNNDPAGRILTTQFSNLDLLSAHFTAMRPMDWEYMIKVGLKDLDNIGWDGYCVDDYMGCEVDLLDSISQGKKLINQEWNIHSTDPRIAARTFWTMIGKGVKGIYCFHLQEGTHHDSYPKWALLSNDFTPKKKLGAYSDAVQEIHRFEPFLMSAKRKYPVKPVALYYSRLDLSLQKRPLVCTWGEQIDTPYRVYALLRGLGYPVRWITPKQIEAGGLKDVGAVVFVEANHIPQQATAKIAQWVKAGGVVIGDQWPGMCDSHGKTQFTLLDVFGVRPENKIAKKGKLALQESSQGYGEETINAIDQENLYSSPAEIWQQWDSKHPVARKVGNFMFSGYGIQNVRCVNGEVIGMTFGGKPGIVVNNFGKGHAMYISAMLGSLYGGSATRYEWDPEHSSNSPARLLDAFLKYSGIKTFATTSLRPQLAAKLRVEIPLMDKADNFFIGLTNFDESKLPDFKLTLAWPEKWPLPKKLLMISGGNRQLRELSFKRKKKRIVLTMPGFDTHASLIGIQKMPPIVALDFSGASRKAAGLLTVNPSQEITCKATVYNLSDSTLKAGDLKLFLPRGWYNDKSEAVAPKIKPWQTYSTLFKIKAPAIATARRLKPITVKYVSGKIKSSPCTEMIWWNNKK